jgi:hypothetical protein
MFSLWPAELRAVIFLCSQKLLSCVQNGYHKFFNVCN